ncbi:MAG: DUF2157 domain-containing protein [Gammaproteobacteria bacterium]|jgi:uncharacterized membrane protein
MSDITKSEAQHRIDQIKAFQDELSQLQHDDVLRLSDEQYQAVNAYHEQLQNNLVQEYDVDRDQRSKQLSRGMMIASFLGAIALAASIFLFFYKFWGYLTTPVQVVILVLAPFVTFAITVYVKGKEKTGYFAKLAAMVSFACFILNLSMLGRIFNITPTENALLVWAAYGLILAYMCDARLLLAAGIISFIGYLSARTGTWSGIYWLYFGERPENFFPSAIVLFLIPQFISQRHFWRFDDIYRVFGMITFFIPVLILSNFGHISYLDWDADIIEGFYQVVGFAVSAGAIVLGIRKHWPVVINTGNVFFVIFLYSKFFDWWWDIMPKYLFFLVIALTAILFLLVYKRLREHELRLLGGQSS